MTKTGFTGGTGFFSSMNFKQNTEDEEDVMVPSKDVADQEQEEEDADTVTISDEEAESKYEIRDEEDEEDSEKGEDEDSDPEGSKKEEESEELLEEESETNPSYEKQLLAWHEKGIIEVDPEKEYEDSEEGIAEIISDTVQKRVESWKEGLGDEAGELLKWVENGGKVQDYLELKSEIDYKEVDPSDDKNKEYLVLDHLLLQGYEEDEAQELLEEYKEKDLLDKLADKAHKKLISHQEKTKEETLKKLEQEKIQQEKIQEKQRIEFAEKVESLRELGGFKFDDKTAKKLKDYVMKTDKEGQTAFAKKDSFQRRMLFAYLDMINFDFSKLEKEIHTKQTINIRKKLESKEDTNAKRRKMVKETEETGRHPKINFLNLITKS